MAKNKDSISKNRTGILNMDELTITYVDPKGKEPDKVYKVLDILKPFDGESVSLTVNGDTEAPSIEE